MRGGGKGEEVRGEGEGGEGVLKGIIHKMKTGICMVHLNYECNRSYWR